ncbi:uncharacterized protein EAF02_004176 [Botrytis sinoallii]|uniref:uncharacterized protein n=1 Tax=Botrytis sinoallii TaxID=1463999 RepID=UPI00190007D9|nr:uncharacterized protein EAF02_004176 [Botrytis sinoallii]KAF7885667.1 hypothetical protein EAF02_004176 [Botrytis sinoallii]
MGWLHVSKGLSLTGNDHQLVFFKRKEGLNHGGPQDGAVSTRAVGAYTRRRRKSRPIFEPFSTSKLVEW